MTQTHYSRAAVALAAILLASGCGSSDEPTTTSEEKAPEKQAAMILATTTSTQDSGLLDELLPDFQKASGCTPKTVAVGSGAAMTLGEKGDADVLLVHSPEAEKEFMADGHGSSRQPVMHNDFVLVGPATDPAGAADAKDAADALRRIAQAEQPFASRADDSGTNAKELGLWEQAAVKPSGSWYLETGQGMGATLTIASQKQAYTLADRGTFLATDNLDSKILTEKSDDLLNPYHVIVVKAHDAGNVACAKKFSTWIRSGPAQDDIGTFGVDEFGEPLFIPDAN